MTRGRFVGGSLLLALVVVLLAARPLLNPAADEVSAASPSAEESPASSETPEPTRSARPTHSPTPSPTESPSPSPTPIPTAAAPTPIPTQPPTPQPTAAPPPPPPPTTAPTAAPTPTPLPPWPNGVGWMVSNEPRPAVAGQSVTYTYFSMPRAATCTPDLTYPGGGRLVLSTQTAVRQPEGNYRMSWTWTIPASTPAGEAIVHPRCTYPGYTFPDDVDGIAIVAAP